VRTAPVAASTYHLVQSRRTAATVQHEDPYPLDQNDPEDKVSGPLSCISDLTFPLDQNDPEDKVSPVYLI